MPCLSIQFAEPLEAARADQWARELSALVSRWTGKPENYVMVVLRGGAAIYFSGTAGHAAWCDFSAIGLSAAVAKK